jgi:auxin-responsive protein IAA
MEGCPRNREIGPKLLDLIPQGRKWYQEDKNNTDQEKKLELRLGPPGGDEEDHSAIKKKNTEIRNIKKETEDKSFHCFNGNHFSPSNKTTSVPHISQKRYNLLFFPSLLFFLTALTEDILLNIRDPSSAICVFFFTFTC